jgi:UDPglucose 6-dehydrogenase
MSRVAVIGTGYVGLTTGAYLAHIGHRVVCADVLEEKVARLSQGDVPIFEVGLAELVRAGLDSGLLRFVVGSEAAVVGAEFVFLCLPTPQGAGGAADLSFIEAEAERLGPLLDPGTVVVNKSTVPVGSTRMVERGLGRGDVFVVSNPEFLREGSAVHDCLNPDRIVIGADSAAAATRVAGLYERINAPVLVTDPASSELIKYASNAFLATKISYVNAIANLCEVVGADVKEVVLGMGYDKRIGFEFLRPGPGWGGSCFSPDETLLVQRREEVRLLSFAELYAEVDRLGADGWEALSWDPAGTGTEFHRVAAFTRRPYVGDMIEVTTKMGRRIVTTADHHFVVGDGLPYPALRSKTASELGTDDWLPLAHDLPDLGWEEAVGLPGECLDAVGLDPGQVIVRCGPLTLGTLQARRGELHHSRRRDVLRCGALRLAELIEFGIDPREPNSEACGLGTTTNGTYIPSQITLDDDFWRVVGLYLAEGSMTRDGARQRTAWHFHPTAEGDLVEFVRSYWERLGIKAAVSRRATSTVVSVSSRILAGWFEHGLGLGRNCYDHRIPDAVWTLPDAARASLLRGLWDGDGSWSKVNHGPSVVYEYGTVSRRMADGILRLLGGFGIVARLKTGRTAKSTVDTYWITIAGADQIERASWLFPEDEQSQILSSIGGQAKRIAPTGYRRGKASSWVRVTGVRRFASRGEVFSVEVPATGTVVTSGGLVVHQCFPKDTKALVKIAQDAGYDFGLLDGVIGVNVEQYERMATKVQSACPDGVLDGETLAVWGLTFKAMTDDLRDSPSLEVIGKLRERGAIVRAYDPQVRQSQAETDRRLEGITVCDDPYDACTGSALLVVLTEWDEFRWLDLEKVRGLLASPVVVDCRNLLDPAAMRKRGFTYYGVGR